MSELLKKVEEARDATGFVALYGVLCMMAEKIRAIELQLAENSARDEALKAAFQQALVMSDGGYVDEAALRAQITAILYPAPVDPAPVDPAPVDPAPVDPAPVDPAPVDQAPVDPAPVDQAPVDPAPVDPAQVDPAQVDPAQV